MLSRRRFSSPEVGRKSRPIQDLCFVELMTDSMKYICLSGGLQDMQEMVVKGLQSLQRRREHVKKSYLAHMTLTAQPNYSACSFSVLKKPFRAILSVSKTFTLSLKIRLKTNWTINVCVVLVPNGKNEVENRATQSIIKTCIQISVHLQCF